jgi:small subunit ribosomal protein S20
MATSKSAKKSYKQADRKRVFNVRVLRVMKSAVKEIKELITKSDKKSAEAAVSGVYKAIDKAVKRGILKKNNAARKKSRLMAAIAKIK